MQRGVRVEQVREAVRLLRDQGIETGMFLMWGYEGEDLSDIEATVEHVKTCRPDVFLTTVSYPIKGTPYYDDVAARADANRRMVAHPPIAMCGSAGGIRGGFTNSRINY